MNSSKLYWPPAVTVDVVIFTFDGTALRVLLIRRKQPPFQNYWALPGGFLLRDETTEKAALRVLKEKTGMTNVYVEQLYTFDSLTRDPRGHVLTVAYYALIPHSDVILELHDNEKQAAFHYFQNLPKLAFDHKSITRYALKRLRYKVKYTNLIYSLLPEKFTLRQLQKAYEIILSRKFDKRNFRKKFFSLHLIRSIKTKLDGSRHRPAQLYSFIQKKPIELKRFF